MKVSYMGTNEVGDEIEEEAGGGSAEYIASDALQASNEQSGMHQLGEILHHEGDENERHHSGCVSSFRYQAWSYHP